MSYRRTTLGQAPQAVAVTCMDGTIIGVPPGGDANAMCREHHLKPDIATDQATMPPPSASDQVVAAPSVPAFVPVPPPVMMPVQTSGDGGWLVPAAIGLAAVGFLSWAASVAATRDSTG